MKTAVLPAEAPNPLPQTRPRHTQPLTRAASPLLPRIANRS